MRRDRLGYRRLLRNAEDLRHSENDKERYRAARRMLGVRIVPRLLTMYYGFCAVLSGGKGSSDLEGSLETPEASSIKATCFTDTGQEHMLIC